MYTKHVNELLRRCDMQGVILEEVLDSKHPDDQLVFCYIMVCRDKSKKDSYATYLYNKQTKSFHEGHYDMEFPDARLDLWGRAGF